MIALLDVNVLVALAWPNHINHEVAHHWFAAHRDHGWATCPVTQAGFVRVSSNQRVFRDAKSPGEALLLLDRIVSLAGHCFFTDEVDFTCDPLIDRERLFGHRQITDAQLLAIAGANGAGVATFDRGMRELLSSDHRGMVIEIPA
jgi:toxin-antitoxin system PIN domain toxin